jgi:hypothetical protein
MEFRCKLVSKIALQIKRKIREINKNVGKLGGEGHTPCQI